MITQDRLRELLFYQPETGLFIWKVGRGPLKAGTRAGSSTFNGYRKIKIDKKFYFEHRLAILYVGGSIPDSEIDHINGSRSDNRYANLRVASRSQNQRNQRLKSTNTSGLKWAVRRETKRGPTWQSVGKRDARQIYLGVFDCPAAAHLRFLVWTLENFGEFARSR